MVVKLWREAAMTARASSFKCMEKPEETRLTGCDAVVDLPDRIPVLQSIMAATGGRLLSRGKRLG
jgi:hypothetical protein